MTLQHETQAAVASFVQGEGPLIDVRSPGEYAHGHIPGAINLPLFSDAERAAVGTAYKQQGREQAVVLGLGAVGARLQELGQTLLHHSPPSGCVRLYCWRGGMRSGSVAWLASTLGLNPQRLDGGYKHFRHWVLERFEQPWPLVLLAGRTGVGKTDVLLALRQSGSTVIDLEGLAHHRGSSFGGLGLPPQPSTEHFENTIALALHSSPSKAPIWLEAESPQVGSCRIPAALLQQMRQAALVDLQRPLTERVARLVSVYGAQEPQALQQATERISRRLGPQRTALAVAAIAEGDMATACEQMLDYYDRCYDHELTQRPSRPVLELEGRGQDEIQLAATLRAWEGQWQPQPPAMTLT